MHGKSPVKGLLFDMDNALLDLVGANLAACRVITGELGEGSPDLLFLYFLRHSRGFDDPENIRDFMLDAGIYSDEAYAWASATYHDLKLSHIEICLGVVGTSLKLTRRGYPLFLATDAHPRDTLPRLEKTGLRQQFNHIVTHDMTWEKKPNPVPLHCAPRMGGIPARGAVEAMFIGDSPARDIAPARKLGLYAVYARYGDLLSSAQDVGGAHFIVEDSRELPPLLENLAGDMERRNGECAAGLP